jgi:hypothetical protein
MGKIKNVKFGRKDISQKHIKHTIMKIAVVIGTLIAVIAAIGIILRIDVVDQFFKGHQWAYVILAVCLIVLYYILYSQQEQEKAASSRSGTLFRNSGYIFYPRISMGTISAQSGPDGFCPMNICGDCMKVWVEDDQLKLNVKLRDAEGNIMGEINNSDFEAIFPHALKSNHDDLGWEVIDPRGRVALQVDMIDKCVYIYGVFYSEQGNAAAIFSKKGFNPIMGSKELVKKWVDQAWVEDPNLITPMFVYPSDMHRGERIGR